MLDCVDEEIVRKYLHIRCGAVTRESLDATRSWITNDLLFTVIDCEERYGALSDENRDLFGASICKEHGKDLRELSSIEAVRDWLGDLITAIDDVETAWREREMHLRLRGLYLR